MWQLPNFFIDNSVEAHHESHTFITIIWEKNIRKRVPAYLDKQFARLEKSQRLKYADSQFEFENLESRESRTVRFCKFFLSLYDLKTTVPFTQFSKPQQIEEIRNMITERLQKFSALLKRGTCE